MAMSKRDYQALARAIYEARSRPEWGIEGSDAFETVTGSITRTLAADNPRFDRQRFIQACETGECKGMRKVG